MKKLIRKRKVMGQARRKIAMFLVTVLLLGLLPNGFYASATAPSGVAQGKERALTWLVDAQAEGGSFGDNRIIKDTTDAMTELRRAGMSVESQFLDAWYETTRQKNTDSLSRYYIAQEQQAALLLLLENQNSDGGFGLSIPYTSDTLDSILALEAFNKGLSQMENDVPVDKADKLLTYLKGRQNTDGGFGLTKESGSSVELTARVGLALFLHLEKRNATSAEKDFI